MKITILLIVAIFLISCGCNSSKTLNDNIKIIENKTDSIDKKNEVLQAKSDSLLKVIVLMFDSLKYSNDSLQIANDSMQKRNIFLSSQVDSLRYKGDSLNAVVFTYGLKLDRIKYYVKICMRNPSQKTFLLGWVRRVIELLLFV